MGAKALGHPAQPARSAFRPARSLPWGLGGAPDALHVPTDLPPQVGGFGSKQHPGNPEGGGQTGSEARPPDQLSGGVFRVETKVVVRDEESPELT